MTGDPRQRPLKALHVMPSMDASYGGPVSAIQVMARGLKTQGVGVDVVSVCEPEKRLLGLGQSWVEKDGFRLLELSLTCRSYRYSKPLERWFSSRAGNYDVVHVHGVFNHPGLLGRRWAVGHGLPLIVRPFGVLNQWSMENRRAWLKQAFFRIIERPSIDAASILHFTSQDEAADVARLQLKAEPVVIPLGLDLGPYEVLPPKELFTERFPQTASGPVILFLSRIDVKKGLEVLLPAFQQVLGKFPDATLVVAGDGAPALVQSLQNQARALGIEPRVVWTGFLQGELKLAAMNATTVYCLPSRSENFGMALLEAMSAGLPCVSTPHVALAAEAGNASAVKLAALTPTELAGALVEILQDEVRRGELSRLARSYAVQHHSMQSVGVRLRQLYDRLVS
jgi:glycosyltransferase involved in cell wall biosynthesis